MKSGSISVTTGQRMELIDITRQIAAELADSGIDQGICIVFNPHTTAGLTINEGADPDVKSDIIDGFKMMVPLDHRYKHAEGNSPAHIMASLMGSSLNIAIHHGSLRLGTWQKVFFCEFDGPRTRKVHFHFLEG